MTTYLTEIFSLDQLKDMLARGYAREQTHPEYPELSILNYAEKATFDRLWNPVTLACRGLIYNNQTLEVVARPFQAFFNAGEHTDRELPTDAALVSDKMDGSLGILYTTPDGDYSIATRGSFASEQAIRGTDIFYGTVLPSDNDFTPLEGKTYLWEIVYPENRIVCDYRGQELLVLLDVIDICTGRSDTIEFQECNWPHKVQRSVATFDAQLLEKMTAKGDEGLVFLWPDRNLRVKVKREDYIELHKIVTGTSEKSIWRLLAAGETVQQLCENLPDEFHAWARGVARRLALEHARIIHRVHQEFAEVDEATADADRAAFAKEAFKQCHNPHYVFMLKDGKDEDLSAAVWKTLEPVGAVMASANV